MSAHAYQLPVLRLDEGVQRQQRTCIEASLVRCDSQLFCRAHANFGHAINVGRAAEGLARPFTMRFRSAPNEVHAEQRRVHIGTNDWVPQPSVNLV
jgi:hypothetical protein